MTGKPLKIFATAAVVVLALTGLLFATLREDTQYYKHVNEVMGNPEAWHGKKLQLHGYVADIERKRNSLEYRFNVQSNGSIVQATYTGVVPDTFKDGSEVVLKGKLSTDGLPRRAERRDGEVPVEVRTLEERAGRIAGRRQLTRAPGDTISHARARDLPASGLVCRLRLRHRGVGGRRPPALAAPDRERHRRLLSRHRADDGGVRRNRARLRHQQLRHQVRPALLRRGAAAAVQDRVVLGRPRRLGDVLGVPARGVRRHRGVHQPGAPSRADSLRRGGHRGHRDVLPADHGGAQQPLRDVPDAGARRRPGVEPAAAELLHGHPSAVALRRPGRHDDPVRVRHRRADHRPPGRRVAARGAALDDDRLARAVVRADARDAVGV